MPDSSLEKIYYNLPVFLQNIIFSAYGFSTYRKRYNRMFFQYLEQLKMMDLWTADEIKEYQDKSFVRIVNHAYRTVPFYRKWYDECGVDVQEIKSLDDLHKLPILTKNMAKKNQANMVSNAYSKRSLVKCLTSGTTGAPMTIYHTRDSLAFQWAVWWRHKSRFGLSRTDRHLTFGARIPIDQNQSMPPYWRKDHINNRVYLSTYHISERTLPDILAFLNRSKFDFFTGYPSAMFILASLIEESGLKLINSPKYIVTGSDALLPKYKETISRVFKAPVTEQYGMVEFAGNMAKCECGLFHEDFECCYIEDMPFDNSELGALLLTGWGNFAMPFIRYEVGDFALRSNQACKCGRNSKCFSSIEGRLEDYILTPDGRRIIGMNQVFEYAKHVKEIQIHQSATDQIVFRVVPEDGFGVEDKEALTREFQRRAGTDISIRFTTVDSLERSSSGKLKAVISDV